MQPANTEFRVEIIDDSLTPAIIRTAGTHTQARTLKESLQAESEIGARAYVPDKSKSRSIAAIYFLHLVVPAFVLVDILTAWSRGLVPFRLATSVTALCAASALWLVAGPGIFFLSRNRQAFLRRALTPLLCIYTTCVSLIILEVLTRLMGIAPPTPYRFKPGTRVVSMPKSTNMPGLSGPKTFTINQPTMNPSASSTMKDDGVNRLS